MKKVQKLGPLQRKWVKALRSGRYNQIQGTLRNSEGHCCMGVACQVVGLRAKKPQLGDAVWDFGPLNDGIIPDKAAKALSLRHPSARLFGRDFNGHSSLWAANDGGASFAQIADFIEAHPGALFTNAK